MTDQPGTNQSQGSGRASDAADSAPESGGASARVALESVSAERWRLALQLISRYGRRAFIVGLAISLLIHLTGLVISSRIWFRSGAPGLPGGNGGVELAVMTEGELGDAMDAALEAGAVGGAPDQMADPTVNEPLAALATMDPTVSSGGLGEVGKGIGAGDIGSSSAGLGSGGAGGGGGASFFGVEAKGERFAYLVDVSGSMEVFGKIQALRAELSASVSGMLETSRFSVTTFSTDSNPLGGRKGWTEANENGKRWAKRAIAALVPQGGTEPLPGFRQIFELRPRPDAIYFMTDGEFAPEVVEAVALLNRNTKIPIHCICFVSRDSETQMKQIATQSGGSYTFVRGPGQ